MRSADFSSKGCPVSNDAKTLRESDDASATAYNSDSAQDDGVLAENDSKRRRGTLTEQFEWLDLSASSDELDAILSEPPVQVTYAEFLEVAQKILVEATLRLDENLRLKALREIATTGLETNQPEVAVQALEEMLESKEIGARPKGIALRDLGRISLRDPERFNEGLGRLKQASDVFYEASDAEFFCHVNLEIGGILGGSGDRESSIEHFSSAREAARSIPRADLVARAEDRLAAAEWELGRLRNAERHLRTALDIALAIGEPEGIGYAKFRLGWKIADDLGSSDSRRDEALELLSASKSHAQENDDLSTVAACDEKAAWVMGDRGEYGRAIGLLSAAISVFEAIGESHNALIARANLARYREDSGDFDGCIRGLRSVIRDANEINDSYLLATCSTRLAKRLLKIGEEKEACDLLDQCESFFESNDNKIEGVRFLLVRASAYNHLGLLEATRETAQLVLDSLERTALPSFHAEALEYLADCALADGDKTKAESLFGQSVALYLIDDELEEAMRVANRILPSPGEKISELVPPKLQTGLYL